jgi:hypothetical protein
MPTFLPACSEISHICLFQSHSINAWRLHIALINLYTNQYNLFHRNLPLYVTVRHPIYVNALWKVTFEVLTAMIMSSDMLWDFTPYSLIELYRRFGEYTTIVNNFVDCGFVVPYYKILTYAYIHILPQNSRLW